ncbi:copper transporter [Quadrisphaera sp. DSM 44207]|uniref:copper transporter n=1 Tax=Quadrisphaera sp. DSM 44207 TaxID=1881057 RepID=UPI00087E9784|nr:copper transporter [Quadrisphaera sp. DSM 44207]SDQ51135.1 Copper transport outer membrane protein, MctB [Quadrisphaera sp. DSM 44207]
MIDFRYHIVSLVSVFLALAIGVVLGAGPLRESIGATLTDQVDALRQDTEDLRQALANREAEVADREAFVQAVAPALVSGRLAGRSAVVVTLPEADGEQVEAVTEALTGAGATVTGQVGLEPAWVDPDQAAFRSSLAAQLAPAGEPQDIGQDAGQNTGQDTEQEGAGAGRELADLLAGALVVPPGPGPDGGAAAPSASVLEALAGGELVSVEGELSGRADTAVVVGGAPVDDAGQDAADTAEAEDAEDAAAQEWLPVVTALDARSSGSVVTAPLASEEGGVLAAVRSGDGIDGPSSVDSLGTTMGPVTTVLALREQLDGGSGQYGSGDGATAVVPPLPGAADS